jgi:hypothetical protein
VVAIGREQLALLGAVGGEALEPLHPSHDQPASDLLALAAPGERSEIDLGDLGVGDPAVLDLVEDRVRVADRSPRLLVDARDRSAHARRHPCGHREPRLARIAVPMKAQP